MNSALSMPRWNGKERASFARRLSFLLRSGMPLPAALGSLAEGESSTRVKAALETMRGEVEHGVRFSEAAAGYPRLLPPFVSEVISAGEASGALSENLSYLAAELEKRAQLRSRLFGALAYPAVITIAAIALTVSLVAFVFPKIIPVFSGLSAQLPVSTRILLAVSDYVRHHGVSTLLALAAICGCAIAAHRSNAAFRKRCERLMIGAPFIGAMLVAYRVSGTIRTLALLIESGMPLPLAIRAGARSAGSILYAEALTELAGDAEEGLPLAAYLRRCRHLFPRLVADMTAAGEASGSLPEALRSLAFYYESEFDESAKRLSTLVEPLLMLFMGGIVGFVAVAMIAPIYEITQHLHGS